ncbi:hypothetical protein RRG08_007289, partial [Elysia crispata]
MKPSARVLPRSSMAAMADKAGSHERRREV